MTTGQEKMPAVVWVTESYTAYPAEGDGGFAYIRKDIVDGLVGVAMRGVEIADEYLLTCDPADPTLEFEAEIRRMKRTLTTYSEATK